MKIIYVDDEMPARINFRLTAEPLDSVEELYLFGNAQSALDWLQERKAGAAQIIGVGNREKWIVRDLVDCDLYRILDGDPQAMRRYSGEYLREYA